MATQDDRPELLIKLQERKARHKQRNILHRALIVLAGVLIVIAGIVMSGPGVPGPGIVTIILGLGFLALEFDWAERWLERVIIWGDRAAERAEQTTTRQRVAAGIATALAVGAFAVAAVVWDIPLIPILWYGSVLLPLFEEDGLRIGEVARRARLSKQTMTTMVRLAERDGLVERRQDERDRRATRVHLTDKGQRFKPVAEGILAELDEIATAALGERGVAAAERALAKLAKLQGVRPL